MIISIEVVYVGCNQEGFRLCFLVLHCGITVHCARMQLWTHFMRCTVAASMWPASHPPPGLSCPLAWCGLTPVFVCVCVCVPSSVVCVCVSRGAGIADGKILSANTARITRSNTIISISIKC